MRNLFIFIAFFSIDALKAQKPKDALTTQQPTPLTLRSIDPVCRMRLRRGAVDSIDYQGVRYGFCDTICKHKFISNPKKFIN